MADKIISPSLLTWSRKSEQLNVSTKTLDRWAQAGIIKPPIKIKKRKYSTVDDKPRTDSPEAA